MGELEADAIWVNKFLFLFGVIPLAAMACLLAWNGGMAYAIGGMVLFVACGLCMYIVGMSIMAAWGANAFDFAHCSKNVLRLVACVLMVCLFISTYNAQVYLKIKDPASSVRGVGVKDLAEAYERNPSAYDVVLTDGFVQTLGAGYYAPSSNSEETEAASPSCSAAPIYKDAASASGVPLAWAVGNQDGVYHQFQATYCPGGGVCGFKSPALSSGSVVTTIDGTPGRDSGHTIAAKRAAQKMGFEFPEGLPALEMINPLITMKSSEKWGALFYPFLFATIACCALAEIETIMAYGKRDEKLDESTPLNAA